MIDKARVVVNGRTVRLYDTEGIPTYEMEMGPFGEEDEGSSESGESRTARLFRERRSCVDCGTTIPAGSIYCKVDAPYGFWHWVAYFSAVRWRR